MTDEHLKRIAKRYIDRLDNLPTEHKDITLDTPIPRKMEHAAWMCERIIYFVDHDYREKAGRWLGFVQAMLWQVGFFTIDELREHNMNG